MIYGNIQRLLRMNALTTGTPLSKAIIDKYCTITGKWCKYRIKLILFTNTKLHMHSIGINNSKEK